MIADIAAASAAFIVAFAAASATFHLRLLFMLLLFLLLRCCCRCCCCCCWLMIPPISTHSGNGLYSMFYNVFTYFYYWCDLNIFSKTLPWMHGAALLYYWFRMRVCTFLWLWFRCHTCTHGDLHAAGTVKQHCECHNCIRDVTWMYQYVRCTLTKLSNVHYIMMQYNCIVFVPESIVFVT